MTERALSIRAPWWWLILHAGKTVENRDWPTKYRGPVLIHASKWFGVEDVEGDLRFGMGIARIAPDFSPTLAELKAGCGHLVGRARIVDCVERETCGGNPWFFGRFGFVLADVEPLPEPIPCKGALGLFRPVLEGKDHG